MLERARLVKRSVCMTGIKKMRLKISNNKKINKKKDKPRGQLMLHTTEGNVGIADKTTRPPERYKYRHEDRSA